MTGTDEQTKTKRQTDEKQKQVSDWRTEALCSVGKVIYCPAALQCINYRIRNDKLRYVAMNRQTQRQTES